MLEKEIMVVLEKRELRPSDVYKTLDIQRAHFYQAIRSSNMSNKTLLKILDYLELQVSLSLQQKDSQDGNI